MNARYPMIAAILVTAMLAGRIVAAAATKPAPPAVSFTAAQAWDGRFDYIQQCAECHGGGLQGSIGPALAGSDDRDQWETGQYVYDYISVHMPHGHPGQLSQKQYLAIMAFLLQQHGKKPGNAALTRAMIEGDQAVLGP